LLSFSYTSVFGLRDTHALRILEPLAISIRYGRSALSKVDGVAGRIETDAYVRELVIIVFYLSAFEYTRSFGYVVATRGSAVLECRRSSLGDGAL
jgi:hypothetical protein